MTQVHYQYSDRYLLWIASKFEIKKNMINWHQSHAKRHWNAFVANKMRCTFCHCVSGGCRASTTGCTAVFLFQAHHALPRKPVLPETWKTSGGSSWGGLFGIACCVSRIVLATRYILKLHQSFRYDLWKKKDTITYIHSLHMRIVWFKHFQRAEGPQAPWNKDACLCQLPLGSVLRLLRFVVIPKQANLERNIRQFGDSKIFFKSFGEKHQLSMYQYK